MAISKDTLAHIRFGYGFRPDSRVIGGPVGLMGQLEIGAAPLEVSLRARLEMLETYRAVVRKERNKEIPKAKAKTLRAGVADLIRNDFRDDLVRQVTSPNGFMERLVAFWADHFTVPARGRILSMVRPAFVDDAIRSHLTGSFGDMLVAATIHPAMLIYLDQNNSIGPNSKVGLRRKKGLNENIAREVLELHTLGVDSGYSQSDVTQFAELLTGLRVNDDGARFLPRFAEPGPETVLGVSYGGVRGSLRDVEAALHDLAVRPETAFHLARKLAVHFVDDDPDGDLIEHIAAAYSSSGGALVATYEALLEHPASWVQELRKVKQPRDYVVSTLRVFGFDAGFLKGMSRKDLRRGISRPLAAMGQAPNQPAGPDGWPEDAAAWITPATLSARIEWVTEMAREFGQDLDPRHFLEMALGDAASQNTSALVAGSESKWEGVGLSLASPEFNRR